MSLINDALKRAKQAQQHAPPPGMADLSLRPVEPASVQGRRNGLMVPAVMVAGVALVLLIAWRLFLKGSPDQSPPRGSPSAETAQANQSAPSLVAKASPAPVVPIASHSEPGSTQPAAAEPPVGTPAVAATATATTPPSAGTNIVSVPENIAAIASAVPVLAPPQQLAPLKLQGILYQPPHPAAMIGGRTLFVGDKLGEWRVVAISQESATLVNAGQTNLLTLPQ